MPAGYIVIGDDLIRDALLGAVRVTHELNHHSWCTVVCRNTLDEPIRVDEALGKDLKVVTYDEEGKEVRVFEGFVLDGELEYELSGAYTARLTAVSLSYKLEVTEQHRYFLAKPLADIANALGGDDGLEVKIDCASKPALNYVQYGEDDFAFLRRLADDHDAWIRPTAQGIEICDHFEDGVELEWRQELGLLSFKAKGSLRQPSFNGHHYDHHQMKSGAFTSVSDTVEFFGAMDGLVDAVQNASTERIPAGYVGQRSRAVTVDDFESRLKKESIRSIGGALLASGVSRDPRIKPGDTVKITGPLAAAGTYGLTKVAHVWAAGGYTNEFECTPWKTYSSPSAPPAQTKLGLVPARVVAHDDPKKMGRIKVRYFWQEDGDGHWARYLTPHAGGDRGFMFMPEVGDEVMVGFEDGDPERPLILGCVWNGVDSAPRQKFYTDKTDMESNWVKRIVTKSGNRIQMVDKPGHEAITLSTPNSAKITLMQNAPGTNRTALSLFTDDGDIFISAPNGRVHIQAAHFSREIGSE